MHSCNTAETDPPVSGDMEGRTLRILIFRFVWFIPFLWSIWCVGFIVFMRLLGFIRFIRFVGSVDANKIRADRHLEAID